MIVYSLEHASLVFFVGAGTPCVPAANKAADLRMLDAFLGAVARCPGAASGPEGGQAASNEMCGTTLRERERERER